METTISQLQSVGALSDLNLLYILLIVYHKYHSVKYLVEEFWEEFSDGSDVLFMLCQWSKFNTPLECL